MRHKITLLLAFTLVLSVPVFSAGSEKKEGGEAEAPVAKEEASGRYEPKTPSLGDLFEMIKALQEEVGVAREEAHEAKEELRRLKAGAGVKTAPLAGMKIAPLVLAEKPSSLKASAGIKGASSMTADHGKETILSGLLKSTPPPQNESEQRLADLERKIKDLEENPPPTTIRTPWGGSLTITGHIKLDVVGADQNVFAHGAIPMLALPDSAGVNVLNGRDVGLNTLHMNWRESRLTFLVTGPEFAGAKTSALFTIDGWSFPSSSGNPVGPVQDAQRVFGNFTDASNALRQHFGFFDLNWDKINLRIGNWFIPYGNYFPDSSLNVRINRGGSYYHSSGVTFTGDVAGGDARNKDWVVQVDAGVYNSPSGIFGLSGTPAEGELSAKPLVAGLIRFHSKRFGVVPVNAGGFTGVPYITDTGLDFEVAGIYAQQNFGQTGNAVGFLQFEPVTGKFETKGIEFRYTVPVVPIRDELAGTFSLRGVAHMGSNLGFQFRGGLTNLVRKSGGVTEADSWGFLQQAKYYVTNELSLVGQYGFEDIERHDGVVMGFPISDGLRITRTIVAGAWYNPAFAKNILVGFEYQYFKDDYQNGDRGDMNLFHFQWYYRF